MRYLFRLLNDVPVLPIMAAIARNTELRNYGPLVLRGNQGGIDCYTEAMQALSAKKMVLDIMHLVGGSRLGDVVVTRINPGEKRTLLAPFNGFYTRHYLVLQGLPGAMVTCGDETVSMLTGELWWVDPKAEHSIINNSRDDRVVMEIDVIID